MKKYGIIAAMQEEMQEIKKIMTETEERKLLMHQKNKMRA